MQTAQNNFNVRIKNQLDNHQKQEHLLNEEWKVKHEALKKQFYEEAKTRKEAHQQECEDLKTQFKNESVQIKTHFQRIIEEVKKEGQTAVAHWNSQFRSMMYEYEIFKRSTSANVNQAVDTVKTAVGDVEALRESIADDIDHHVDETLAKRKEEAYTNLPLMNVKNLLSESKLKNMTPEDFVFRFREGVLKSMNTKKLQRCLINYASPAYLETIEPSLLSDSANAWTVTKKDLLEEMRKLRSKVEECIATKN